MADADRDRFPFAFVGAGDVAHPAGTGVLVLFARPPADADRAAITDRLPVPLQVAAWEGQLLAVGCGEELHHAIVEAYPADPGDDDHDGQWFAAAASRVARFNTAVERWLREAHTRCPILVALRPEEVGTDDDSDYFTFSAWHGWSLARLPQLLPPLAEIVTAAPGGQRPWWVFQLAGRLTRIAGHQAVAVPEALLDWVDPVWRERAALAAGDGDRLAALIAEQPPAGTTDATHLQAELAQAIDVDDANHRAAVVAAAPRLLSVAGPVHPDLAFQVAVAAVRLRLHTDDRPTQQRAEAALDALCPLLGAAPDLAARIAYRAGYAAGARCWPLALALYDLLLDAPTTDPAVYADALAAVRHDHADLRPERAGRYLTAALPHAPTHPAIFHQAACVHTDLGEHDQALQMLHRARAHGVEQPAKIRDEPVFRPLADDPRFQEIFADLDPAPVDRTTALTATNFHDAIRTGVVLVNFWSGWDRLSQRFAPIYQQASVHYPDVTFGTVDVDDDPDLIPGLTSDDGLRTPFGEWRGTPPMLIAYRNGVIADAHWGGLSAPDLTELIVRVRQAHTPTD